MTDGTVDDEEEKVRGGSYASPPCFMHDVDPAYSGLVVDADQERDVARWRVSERKRLIGERLALSRRDREENTQRLSNELDARVDLRPDAIVSVYWPIKGEPDLRRWMETVCERGARVALPVVVVKGQALEFREWLPDCRMEPGVWNIPVPVGTPAVVPSVVIAPVVGFDAAGYRLGYGGGYFDRTLGAMQSRPRAIGVGHPNSAIRTIYPQWHDIPMDVVVTGSGRSRSIEPSARGTP